MDLQIIHLEDNADDAFLIRRALVDAGIVANIVPARDRTEFGRLLASHPVDLVLADSGVPGFSGLEALKQLRGSRPDVPFICVTGSDDLEQRRVLLEAGADDFVQKDQEARLIAAVQFAGEKRRLILANRGMARLVAAVQELSMARDLNGIMNVVRSAARELTGADGATFVLREGGNCYYAEENAISPLWKGQRFPMSACISGWVMLNREAAVIEDIYSDPRIPADAYRPTFVKSLAMVPIRTESPIGAIGNYWAQRRRTTTEELELLKALANTTAVAMENVRVYNELEQRVERRTGQLAAANQELEAFAYAVSHDLGAPLRAMRSYSELMLKDCSATLNQKATGYLERIQAGARQMRALMDDLLRLSRVTRTEMSIQPVDLSALARDVLRELSSGGGDREVDVVIAEGLEAQGDPGLLRIALENLLSNAWKFTSKTAAARIEVGVQTGLGGVREFFVRDNGAGFDPQYSDKLFQPFRRFHSEEEFSGSGIGLSTVKRVLIRHGGSIRAESSPGRGAAFFFTLNGPKP